MSTNDESCVLCHVNHHEPGAKKCPMAEITEKAAPTHDLGPLPRIHPREKIVREAASKLRLFLVEVTKDLTEAEGLRIVNDVLSSHIGSIAHYAIRAERHPGEPDTPGGWE